MSDDFHVTNQNSQNDLKFWAIMGRISVRLDNYCTFQILVCGLQVRAVSGVDKIPVRCVPSSCTIRVIPRECGRKRSRLSSPRSLQIQSIQINFVYFWTDTSCICWCFGWSWPQLHLQYPLPAFRYLPILFTHYHHPILTIITWSPRVAAVSISAWSKEIVLRCVQI
jgi:hypothetical protein